MLRDAAANIRVSRGFSVSLVVSRTNFIIVFIAVVLVFCVPASHTAYAEEDDHEIGGAPGKIYSSYETPKLIPPRIFAKNGAISTASISPDGKHYLITQPSPTTVRIQVIPVDDDNHSTHYVDNVQNSYFSDVYWASNDRLLVQADVWRLDSRWRWYRIIQLLAVDIDGGNVEKVYSAEVRKPKADVDDVILHTLPNEPDHVLITASENGKTAPSVSKLDIYTGEAEEVLASREGVTRWIADNDGVVRMGVGTKKGKFNLIARIQGSEEWIKLHNNELFEDGRFFPLSFDFDGHSMFVRSAVANGRFAIYRLDLRTGKLSEKLFEHGDVDARNIEVSNTRKKLLAVTYIDDKLQRKFFDKRYEKLHRLMEKALPGRSNYVLSKSQDDRFLLVFSQSDRYPGAIYRLDSKTGKMMLLSEMNTAINPSMMSRMKRINYFARDGLEIPAYVTIPRKVDAKSLPAILLPHGGPLGRSEIEYDRLVQFLVSRGYVVIQPNYRGSTGYSYEFQSLGYGEWGAAMRTDIEDAVDHLVDEGIVDENRVCIMGQSAYGSYTALISGIISADRFKCVIAISPITDLATHVKETKKYSGKTAAYRISGERKSKEIKKISPYHMIKQLTQPLLMYYGDKDRSIDAKSIKKFEKILKKAGKKYEMVRSDAGGHGLDLPKVRTKFYRKLEAFLAEHIGEGTVATFLEIPTHDTATSGNEAKQEQSETAS